MLVIQLFYQQVENYIVYRRAVELTEFTTIVAVRVAGSLLGVVWRDPAVPFAASSRSRCAKPPAPRRAGAALRATELPQEASV